MKPDVSTAMLQLIQEIRKTLPFEQTEAQTCAGPCQGCSLKLLNFLESELDDWEARITSGERPGLADLSQLTRTSRKVARVLEKSNLIIAPGPGDTDTIAHPGPTHRHTQSG